MINTSQTSLGNFVEPALLGTRLDATYYTPAAIQAEHKLIDGQQLGLYVILPLESISSYIMDFQAFSIYNFVEFSETYKDGWIEFLRVQDLRRGYVDTGKVLWTSPESHNLMKKSQVLPGDILLSIIGTLGVAARWTEKHECNSNQCIAKIRLKPNYDPGYVIAALNSPTMQILIHRDATGTVQKGLSLGGTRRLRLPIPDPKIQAYIGDKVRLAEKCREEALISKTRASQKLKEQIQHNEQEVATHYSDKFEKLLGIPYCVSIKAELLSERLTAVSYNNNFLEFMALVNASEHVFVELGEHYDISAMIGWKNLTTADYVRQGIKMLRVTDISGYFVLLNDAVQVSSSKVDEQPQIHLQTGDVVFSKDGTLGIAAVMPKVDELVCAGSTLARLRKRTQLLDPYYLCAFLNSPYTAAQISYYISGIAQPHITQEYIKQIKVPLLPTSSQLEIGREFHRYDFMSRTAYDLISDAKSDIEKLVEGKLGVSELASGKAQQPTWNDIEKLFDDQSH